MKRELAGVALSMILCCGSLSAQDEPKNEKPSPAEEEDELTPEQAVKSLDEIRELMMKSEELLHLSSNGKEAIEKQKDLLAKIDELLKETEKNQKSTMEKIGKLMEKSEGEQKDTIDKLTLLIKKAKEAQGNGQPQPQPQPGDPQEKDQQGQPKPKDKSGNPATKPYDPSKTEQAEALKKMLEGSLRWGDLPQKMRDQILMGEMDIEKFPPEYRDILENFFKELMKENGK